MQIYFKGIALFSIGANGKCKNSSRLRTVLLSTAICFDEDYKHSDTYYHGYYLYTLLCPIVNHAVLIYKYLATQNHVLLSVILIQSVFPPSNDQHSQRL